ncbi:MAG: UbiA family prenyltransferase, partial [Candidatus Aenigmarchaeota archaeon]|nr:UbiA family prenyltransferase [Candidatus Aenigmarchaeota archaeon]
GLALAGMVNTLAMAIALLNSVVLALYAVALQGRLLVGNASISYLVGSSFLFGGAVMGNLLLPGLLFLLAFFANLAREIVKDLEDLAGDRKGLAKLAQQASKLRAKVEQMLGIGKGKSLALRFGEPLARAAAAVTLLIAIGLSPLPYLLGTLSFSYLLAVLPADAAFLSVIYGLAQGDKKYGKLSKRIKLAMLLGMLAFVAGILIRL